MTRLLVHWGAPSHRSDGLARALGAELAYLADGPRGGAAATALRYARARRDTLALLERRRPSLLVVPSLPLPLPMAALAWAAKRGAAVAIDGHTGAFRGKWWARARPLVRSLCRRAALVVAHNRTDQATLAGWGARAILLPDVVHPLLADGPELPARSLAYVTSFGRDDPLDVVFAAAALLPDVEFRVTGRPPAGLRPPPNVRLTGFLPRDDYLGLLAKSGLVAALTRTPDLMQIAADEALCLARPAAVSDSPVLREVLGDAAAYCDNSAQGFAAAVGRVLDAPEAWRRAAESQRQARMRNLAAQVAAMAALLGASGYKDSCPTRSCA